MVLVGAGLGGHYCPGICDEAPAGEGRPLLQTTLSPTHPLTHPPPTPQAVEKVVLIDAQGFIDGIGPMATLPRALAAAGVWVLRTEQLRMAANRMAYHDQAFATEDAMRVGRLHTHLDGWWVSGCVSASAWLMFGLEGRVC